MNTAISAPAHIKPQHWAEWLSSGVDPDFVAMNVRSLSGETAIQLIAEEAIAQAQKVTSYVTASAQRIFERYKPLENGGWWVSGLDPLNGWQQMEWGQFKPDTPRIDLESGKPIKYEAPAKTQARAFFGRASYFQTLKYFINLRLFYGDKFKAEAAEAIREIRSQSPRGIDFEAPEESEINQAIESCLSQIQTAVETGKFERAANILQSLRYCSRGDETESGSASAGRVEGSGWLSLENPRFWPWVVEWNLPLMVTEGAKKGGSLVAEGFASAALPGITMGVRTQDREGNRLLKPQLIPELGLFATAGREIVVCFDYETKPKTLKNVQQEIEKLKTEFTRKGCNFRILQLPGPQKGVDDFIVAQGSKAFSDCYAARLSFERWQTQRLSLLTYPATVELNQRYLGDLNLPDSARLVAIKSPKGTGKTESFKAIVEAASQSGQRVLLISHRVQLAQAICDRVGLNYVTELRTSEEGALLGYGLCIDSLHPESQARFNAEYWHDAIVIVDEAEQVFWHLLDATTEVGNRRTPILNELKKLLTNTLESDQGRVILSDADLSNLSLEFVWALAEQRCPAHIIVNHYQPEEPWLVTHYDDRKPDQWLAALDTEVATGGKVFVFSQSQRSKSRWSTTSIEAFLVKRHPDKKFLRVDSQTIADPSHPAYLCTSKLNEIVSEYDGVIASPSIETGVSIDVRGHFSSVWGCLNGVTPENSARQSLARVREPVPRHIWVSPRGLGKVGSGSTNVRAILSAEYQINRITAKLVQLISFDEELISAYGPALKTWAKMAARINAGLINYRETVLAGLVAEGHIVESSDMAEATNDILQELEEARAEQHSQECEAISAAEEITPQQYTELKGKKAKSAADRHKERKHLLQQRYQVEVTPELVEKDDDGWYAKLRLYYYLGMGKTFLQERDRERLEGVTQSAGYWLPTLNKTQISARIWLLENLGVKGLLNPDLLINGGTKAECYEDAHPILVALKKIATRHAWHIKTLLGCTVSEKMSAIQVAQTLLGKLGIKLNCVGQEGSRGDRQRIYKFEAPKDERDPVLSAWFIRDEAARAEREREQQELVHTPSKNISTGGKAA